jgi:hypothetical protein
VDAVLWDGVAGGTVLGGAVDGDVEVADAAVADAAMGDGPAVAADDADLCCGPGVGFTTLSAGARGATSDRGAAFVD